MQVFTFLTILLFGAGCNGQDKKGLTKEKVAYTKLIKTIGSPNYNVRCGLQDKAGNLWFGTRNGLYKYDGKSFSQFLVANGLNSNNIYCILEDKDGKIWIGTNAGLCLYDGKTFAKIQIPLPKNQPPNKNDLYRNSHWVFSIMQAKSGKLWFATIDGVYIYDGKSFTPFIVNEGARGFRSSNNNVEHILEDKAGNIWFGGRPNEGVYRYDGKSVINIKPVELSYARDTGPIRFDSFELVKIGPGLNCKTKMGIFGSAIGMGPTGMMANHLQVLQKKMAYPVTWLPEL